jgi:hypothetical protein
MSRSTAIRATTQRRSSGEGDWCDRHWGWERIPRSGEMGTKMNILPEEKLT